MSGAGQALTSQHACSEGELAASPGTPCGTYMKPGGNTCSEQTLTALSTFAPVRSPEPSLCVVGVVPGTDGCRLATGSGVSRTGSGSGVPAEREETVGSCGALTRNAQLPVTVETGMVACVHRSLGLGQETTRPYEAKTTDDVDYDFLQAPDSLQAPRRGTPELVAAGNRGPHQLASDVADYDALSGFRSAQVMAVGVG